MSGTVCLRIHGVRGGRRSRDGGRGGSRVGTRTGEQVVRRCNDAAYYLGESKREEWQLKARMLGYYGIGVCVEVKKRYYERESH